MLSDPKNVIEAIGPCTDDIRDCEIMRAAIAHQEPDPTNDRAQALRAELAKSACQNCLNTYLSDIH